MAYRQTNTIRPTETQFKELFELQYNTFWEHGEYTYYDPKLVFSSKEDMRDEIYTYVENNAKFYQMWWEDDTLLGFRTFMDCTIEEDASGGYVNSGTPDGPISKIIGKGYESTTLRSDLFIGRPDSTGSQQNWMFHRPEVAPIWDNKDGETLFEAFWRHGAKRAYSCTFGKLQKQHLWNNRDCECFKHDIFLQNGYSFNERREVGFDTDEDTSFIYRLVGGESLGWPPMHSMYHHNNATRPDKVERPYMDTLDGASEPPAPPVPETVA